jgi:hypothetical protein
MPWTLKKILAFACMFTAWPLLALGDLAARAAGSLLDAAAHFAGKE